jgi:hypothetical protein
MTAEEQRIGGQTAIETFEGQRMLLRTEHSAFAVRHCGNRKPATPNSRSLAGWRAVRRNLGLSKHIRHQQLMMIADRIQRLT